MRNYRQMRMLAERILRHSPESSRDDAVVLAQAVIERARSVPDGDENDDTLAEDLRVAAGALHRSDWEDSAHRRLLNRAADFFDAERLAAASALDEVENPAPLPVGAPGSVMRRAWDLGRSRELMKVQAELDGLLLALNPNTTSRRMNERAMGLQFTKERLESGKDVIIGVDPATGPSYTVLVIATAADFGQQAGPETVEVACSEGRALQLWDTDPRGWEETPHAVKVMYIRWDIATTNPPAKCRQCGSLIDREALRKELEKIEIPETSKRAAASSVFCKYSCMLEHMIATLK